MSERQPTYWICAECAMTKHPDWRAPDHAVTIIMGLCGHCDWPLEVMLTPVVDYDRGPGKRPIHD